MNLLPVLSVLIAWMALVGPRAAGAATPDFPLLKGAHAHNDYEHPRPLFDALDQGFCSVEADIHLVDGRLLVAHSRAATRPDRTLESLYLDPLRERVRANRGHVYPEASEFTLLIDIKTEADPTYAVLRGVLHRYRGMLTRFTATRTDRGAITVILSGERPMETVKAERTRWCAIDGRLPDLDSNPSVHLVPLVSNSWSPTFAWRGQGAFPPGESARLRAIVARAHAQGRRIRFWGMTDDPVGWQVLQEAGVDLLNADDLPGLRRFVLSHPAPPAR